jgi:hypothetical protein
MWLMFAAGMVMAGALNQTRWAIWPSSGGPMIGSDPRTAWQVFGWLGGPPGYGRPIGPIYTVTR